EFRRVLFRSSIGRPPLGPQLMLPSECVVVHPATYSSETKRLVEMLVQPSRTGSFSSKLRLIKLLWIFGSVWAYAELPPAASTSTVSVQIINSESRRRSKKG